MLVILGTQETEIKKIKVQSQPGQLVFEPLSQKAHHKKWVGAVAQSTGPEFKPHFCKKKKKKKKR
jgi:hypothetical protein